MWPIILVLLVLLFSQGCAVVPWTTSAAGGYYTKTSLDNADDKVNELDLRIRSLEQGS